MLKLKKHIFKPETNFFIKFKNFKSIKKINHGNYFKIKNMTPNKNKLGINNFRKTIQTVVLLKQKRRKNSMTLVVSTLYKHEKVKFWYPINCPHTISVIRI